jgi:hypothetical protein
LEIQREERVRGKLGTKKSVASRQMSSISQEARRSFIGFSDRDAGAQLEQFTVRRSQTERLLALKSGGLERASL